MNVKMMNRRGSWALVLMAILMLVLSGCENPSGSDENSSPDPTEGFADPTGASDEVLEEITNDLPVADPGGSTYTFQVRDEETDQPITSDVTVNVTNGTSTAVDSSGKFTITPNSSGRTRFDVQIPGYDVVTQSVEVNDENIVYKRPIVEGVIGEWTLYEVWDRDDREERPIFNETVTFRQDGTATWTGDREFSRPTYYYSAFRTGRSGRPIEFGSTNSIQQVDLSLQTPTLMFLHAGTPNYYEDDDIFEITIDRFGGLQRLRYSRDGNDPFDDGGDDDGGGGTPGQVSGTLSFRGSSLSGTAVSDGEGTWSISTSSVTVAVVNAPSAGTASLGDGFYLGASTEPGITVVQGSTSYISTSGSIDTRNGNLSISASVVDAVSLVFGGGTSYSFTFTPD